MMNRAIDAFNRYASDYDQWFDTNRDVFNLQLACFRSMIPRNGTGLDIGVGSGRFSQGLGIRHGIDPARVPLSIARQRGVETVQSAGEYLPYHDGTFDYVLMMTVICFVEDISRLFREVFRVIRPGGILIIGFLEKEGEVTLGERGREPHGRFLQYATFRSADDVMTLLHESGFSDIVLKESIHGFWIVTAQKE